MAYNLTFSFQLPKIFPKKGEISAFQLSPHPRCADIQSGSLDCLCRCLDCPAVLTGCLIVDTDFLAIRFSLQLSGCVDILATLYRTPCMLQKKKKYFIGNSGIKTNDKEEMIEVRMVMAGGYRDREKRITLCQGDARLYFFKILLTIRKINLKCNFRKYFCTRLFSTNAIVQNDNVLRESNTENLRIAKRTSRRVVSLRSELIYDVRRISRRYSCCILNVHNTRNK